MTGLANSVVNETFLPKPRPVIQIALLPVEDDPQRRIAELEQRLRDSEQAYDTLCDKYLELELAHRHSAQTIGCLQRRLELYTHVLVYAQHGLVRGRS